MAKNRKIVVEQGAVWQLVVVAKNSAGAVEPIDGAVLCARTDFDATTEIFHYTEVDAEIVVDGPNGQITINVSGTTTGAYPVGKHVYEVRVTRTSDGTPHRLLEGPLEVTPAVCIS